MLNWGLTLTEGKASQKAKPHRMQGLTEGPTLWTKARSQRRHRRASQKAKPHRSQGLTEGKASQKPGSHGRPGLTEGKASQKARCVTHSRDSHPRHVSRLKQRHAFLEHKVSHVELRPNPHRIQGLTESKVSQRVQHYEQRQGLREGRASQKPGSHGRPGLAEGKTLEKARCVTHSRDSHNRQGEASQKASHS